MLDLAAAALGVASLAAAASIFVPPARSVADSAMAQSARPATAPVGARGFQDVLATYGIPCTVRQRRGIDIAAGCGQLAVAEQ